MLSVIPDEIFRNILPQLVDGTTGEKAGQREGHLALFAYLPRTAPR